MMLLVEMIGKMVHVVGYAFGTASYPCAEQCTSVAEATIRGKPSSMHLSQFVHIYY